MGGHPSLFLQPLGHKRASTMNGRVVSQHVVAVCVSPFTRCTIAMIIQAVLESFLVVRGAGKC